MICRKCNAEIDDNSKFCTECGSAVVVDNKTENKNEENQNIDRQMDINEFFSSSKGRISRIEFFTRGFLPLTILLFVILIMQRVVNSINDLAIVNLIAIILVVFINYMIAVVSIKRFHDFNYNGWTYLLMFIPLINIIILLMLMFKNKVDLGNRFSDNRSNYSMNGTKWFFLVFYIALLLTLMVIFSISNTVLKI